jgi:hypothetical protein
MILVSAAHGERPDFFEKIRLNAHLVIRPPMIWRPQQGKLRRSSAGFAGGAV